MIEVFRLTWSFRVLWVVLLCFISSLQHSAFAKSAKRTQVYSAVVTRVVDGDTVWIRTLLSAKTIKVRIVGIDAPEACQSGGRASSDALYRRLMGQSVTVSATSSRSRDVYGRLLAKVDLRGEDIGHWMVLNGYAWSYGYRRKPGPYAVEQSQAVTARRGLFNEARAENPRLFRKRHGSCYS